MPDNPTTLICPECRTSFDPGKRRNHQYCSRHCASLVSSRLTPQIPIAERFWPKVDKTGDCWLWCGARNQDGYGIFCIGYKPKRRIGAHRIAWELTHGAIPEGLVVCHRCDNPPCVNPAHLFLGTRGDNTRDMVAKGRNSARTKPERTPRGERVGGAKLTPEKVRMIREAAANHVQQWMIGRVFGVSQRQVGRIVHRKDWQHVD